jgi:hypothetical protein
VFQKWNDKRTYQQTGRETDREREREKGNERNFISIIAAQVQTRENTATWANEMDSVIAGLSWKLRLDVYVRFHQETDKGNDNEVLHRRPCCSTNGLY